MKVYIFLHVETLTSNWHEDGGLVVVAEDKRHAKRLIAAERVSPTDDEWAKAVVFKVEGSPKPAVFVFPNAGCC